MAKRYIDRYSWNNVHTYVDIDLSDIEQTG